MTDPMELAPGPFPKKLGHSFAWRFSAFGRGLLGTGRWGRFLLESAWVIRRLALEETARFHGEAFFGLAYPSLAFLQARLSRQDRVLDLGCGSGRISRGIAPFCREVVAVDYDGEALARASHAFRVANVRWIRADLSRGIPAELGEENFDWIVCSHVLEHLPWEGSARLLRLLASRGSRLLVELPDFGADPLNEIRRRQGLTWVSDADHKQEFTRDLLLRLLEENGWQVESARGGSGVLLAAAVARSGERV